MSHISYLHTWWTWRRWSYLIVLASGVTNMSYNMQAHLSCLPCLNASDIWSAISIVTRWMSQSLMDGKEMPASSTHCCFCLPSATPSTLSSRFWAARLALLAAPNCKLLHLCILCYSWFHCSRKVSEHEHQERTWERYIQNHDNMDSQPLSNPRIRSQVS